MPPGIPPDGAGDFIDGAGEGDGAGARIAGAADGAGAFIIGAGEGDGIFAAGCDIVEGFAARGITTGLLGAGLLIAGGLAGMGAGALRGWYDGLGISIGALATGLLATGAGAVGGTTIGMLTRGLVATGTGWLTEGLVAAEDVELREIAGLDATCAAPFSITGVLDQLVTVGVAAGFTAGLAAYSAIGLPPDTTTGVAGLLGKTVIDGLPDAPTPGVVTTCDEPAPPVAGEASGLPPACTTRGEDGPLNAAPFDTAGFESRRDSPPNEAGPATPGVVTT